MAKKAKVPYAGKEKRNGKKLPVPPPKLAQQAASPVSKTAMPLTGKAALDAIKATPAPRGSVALASKDFVGDLAIAARESAVDQGVIKKNGKPTPDAKTQPERIEAVKKMLSDPKKNGIPPALQVQNRKPLSTQQQAEIDKKLAKAKAETPEAKQAALRAAQKAEKSKPKGGRKLKKTPSGKIKLLVKENPKRSKAAKRFALYKSGMSTADYVKAAVKIGASESLANADIRWDIAHEFISVQ